ncbi:MAG: acylphosphatase [Sphingomonadaceae bacterium]
MDVEPHICRHLHITGRVQGVGYRDWVVGTARALGLNGWVRNRLDGSVEAVAVGAPEAVAAFVDACSEGPALARVAEITVRELSVHAFDGFEFRPTV